MGTSDVRVWACTGMARPATLLRRIAAAQMIALGLLGLALAACGSARPMATQVSVPCTRYASPRGSDRNPGTSRRPVRRVAALMARLRPGQTGCLGSGRYVEDLTISRSGRPGHPLTLRAAPGASATLAGRLYLTRTARYVTIQGLRLDGANRDPDCAPVQCPSPQVDGAHDRFLVDDVTNDHTGICFDLGSHSYGHAIATVIAYNRIHDCGRLPATNHNHGIYVEQAWYTRITHNVISDNADRGIQLYPHATKTLIDHNLIIANGEGLDFSGLGADTSNGNIAVSNVIMDSLRGPNVYSYYDPGTQIGSGNVVMHNCIGEGVTATARNPLGVGSAIGFQLHDNVAPPRSEASAMRALASHAPPVRAAGRCGGVLSTAGT